MKLLVLLFCVLAGISANFLQSNTYISANLYKALSETNGGSFVACPLSVQIIFNLINAGARGKTAQEISEALRIPSNPNEITADITDVMRTITKLNNHNVYNVVNKIYVHKTFNIAPDYKDIALSVFKSEIEGVDFADKEGAAREINQWVSAKTNNKIHNLITRQDLSDNTPAVLINTVYLEAPWSDRFTSSKPEAFHVDRLREITIEMMEQNKLLMYNENQELNAKFLRMRYLKSSLAMIIVLPNEVDGLGLLEANIDRVLQATSFQNKKVHVKLPQFEISNTVELLPILQKWGITELFRPQADLRGVGLNQEPLYITKVLQKNFIQVDKNGTSAASATIVTPRLGATRGKIQQKEFFADHPFLYYITSPNGIVFLGRYTGH